MQRDLVGYGRDGVDPKWPDGKKLAVQFVVNYEEGGESCVLNGDAQSEHLLTDLVGVAPVVGQRYLNMESLYEYGSRVGFWRLHRLFTKFEIPVTVFAVGLALEQNPEAAQAMLQAGWEVASHGYRWIDYRQVDDAIEEGHLARTVDAHRRLLQGQRPIGLYLGNPSERTRRLVVQEGGFLYDSDAYNDELPYWIHDFGRPHLVIPYTLCTNDMKFVSPGGGGFSCGEQFFQVLKDTFDFLLKEGRKGRPKMMSIGLHGRITGHPARCAALQRFLEYLQRFRNDVWLCRREDIARHWYQHHFPSMGSSKLQAQENKPSPQTLSSPNLMGEL